LLQGLCKVREAGLSFRKGLTLQSSELTTKRLELLKEVMPQALRIAILQQAGNPAHPMVIRPSAARLVHNFDRVPPDYLLSLVTLRREVIKGL
jgi:hypothetical protein